MSQFDLYQTSSGEFDFVVELQNDLVETRTAVVAPLLRADKVERRVKKLMPLVSIDQMEYIVQIPNLAAVSRTFLKSPAGDLTSSRDELLAALDFLFVGF
ncbi:CcdB family protein [Endozoicomonas arenosclerae]|uniref:CcdB family protein n=1 Tax=Endozoicomonas arenosclerae TaxID=1633495 RepID=UPI0007847F24|nr:CcdB family protein [Endozoicomonas arenosclerae]